MTAEREAEQIAEAARRKEAALTNALGRVADVRARHGDLERCTHGSPVQPPRLVPERVFTTPEPAKCSCLGIYGDRHGSACPLREWTP